MQNRTGILLIHTAIEHEMNFYRYLLDLPKKFTKRYNTLAPIIIITVKNIVGLQNFVLINLQILN